jgi:hypothetical protein
LVTTRHVFHAVDPEHPTNSYLTRECFLRKSASANG